MVIELTKKDDLYKLMDVLIESPRVHGLMVLGPAGIGKTYNVLKYLKDHKIDYSLVKTYTTPLALYAYLYNHRNDRIIVFDDVDGIWENDHSAALMKSALWEDDQGRRLEWHSTSKYLEQLGLSDIDGFYLKAKIIFMCNKTRDNPHVAAVLSRILHYKFRYTRVELYEEARRICEADTHYNLTTEEKLEVAAFINDMAAQYDFRTIVQGLTIREHADKHGNDWRSILFDILQDSLNDQYKYVYETARKGAFVEEAVKGFVERFGKSRRTYFYIKKRLRDAGCL